LTRVDPWTSEIRHTYIQADGGTLFTRVYLEEKTEKMQDVRANDLQELLTKLFQVKLKIENGDTEVLKPMIESICPGHPFQMYLTLKKKGERTGHIVDQRSPLTRTDSVDSLK